MSIKPRLSDVFNAVRRTFFPTPQELEQEKLQREIDHNKNALTLAVQGIKLEKIYDYPHMSMAAGIAGVATVMYYPDYVRSSLANAEKQPEIDRIKGKLRELGVTEQTITNIEEKARQEPSPHQCDYM